MCCSRGAQAALVSCMHQSGRAVSLQGWRGVGRRPPPLLGAAICNLHRTASDLPAALLAPPRLVTTHLLLALSRVDCGARREGACAGGAGRALKIMGDAVHALMSLWACFSVHYNVRAAGGKHFDCAECGCIAAAPQPPAPWGPRQSGSLAHIAPPCPHRLCVRVHTSMLLPALPSTLSDPVGLANPRPTTAARGTAASSARPAWQWQRMLASATGWVCGTVRLPGGR
jgi:hypothetical protein